VHWSCCPPGGALLGPPLAGGGVTRRCQRAHCRAACGVPGVCAVHGMAGQGAAHLQRRCQEHAQRAPTNADVKLGVPPGQGVCRLLAQHHGPGLVWAVLLLAQRLRADGVQGHAQRWEGGAPPGPGGRGMRWPRIMLHAAPRIMVAHPPVGLGGIQELQGVAFESRLRQNVAAQAVYGRSRQVLAQQAAAAPSDAPLDVSAINLCCCPARGAHARGRAQQVHD